MELHHKNDIINIDMNDEILTLNKKEKEYLKQPLQYLFKTAIGRESLIPVELINIKDNYLFEKYEVAIDDKFVDSLNQICSVYSSLSIPQKGETLIAMLTYRMIPKKRIFYVKNF